MYPSKGNTPYGQQVYGSSQSYGLAGSGYSGNPVGSSDADLSSYRAYASQTAQYGGPYAAVYSSSAVTNVQQVGGVGSKEAVSTSNLQSRSTYQSALAESSKFPSGTLVSGLGITTDDYGSAAAHVYSQKGDQFSSVKNPDYVASDRRHYSEHQGAFAGRDSQNDSSRRYLESVSLNSRHQVELHNRMDQASLRQQQLMKAQQLQPGTNIRQDECYTPMSLPTHSQEISGYGARMDADPRGLSGFSAAYGGQVAASIIGGAPRRNVDDLMYVQGSSNAAYGVGLPPGRDYAAGKGILGTPRESNYQSSVLARSHPVLGVSMVDERNDDRHAYRRELEIREEERRRELLWEREKEREREERERERERERECERERERKRERERERERLQEHREKERERERRHALEARRERTPPRPIRDRRGSSLIKDKKAVRRATPHREAVHRHHSPVKEKKREYICKVYPFCLVDVERDHLSVSKRYPRLVIAADFSKAIVNWPRETLNLSLHTPVSFEHDFLDVEDKSVEKGPVSLQESSKSKGVKTVWNTKVILMSGISVEALQELCFGKDTDEKPVHVNNILKFAVMKKDRSFSAIGGPSHVSSDGDLQVDDFSLIQTAIRHVKHLTQLDLHSCHHWNRFLEIHYDRVGKDGFFSHKEVTVFYVPNISECLPSLDQWRGQWLTYKKEKTEREQVSKEKKPAEKKESGLGGKTQSKTVNNNSAGTLKSEDNLVKEDMADVKGNDQSKVDVGEPNKIPSEQNEKTLALDDTGRKDVVVVGGPSKISENLVTGGGSVDLSAEIKKTTKKKVVKKVVKGKVVSKKAIIVLAGSSIKQEENMDIEDGITEDKHGNADKEDTISADLQRPATVTMTIVTKGTPGKSPLTEDKANSSEALTGVKTKNEPTVMDGTQVVKNEHDGGSVAQDVEVKTTGKKKIIRRVIKRKIYTPKVKDAIANKNTEDTKEDVKSDLENKETVELNISENKTTEESSITNKKDHLNEKTVTDEKTKRETKSVDSDAVPEKRAENVNGSEIVKEKSSKKSGQDGKERKKDEKEKSKDGNQKSNKEKEKGGSLEPPKHPGLILKSHRSKGSKVRSVSLSLDGLLDYSDKDIEESSYELSLFAEAFNEMLQFEMGCRLLSFLEKLNKKYTLKRNSRKRQRDEKSEKVSEKEKSPIKRPKSNGSPVAKEDTSNKDKGEAANIVSGSIKSGKEDASDKTDSENKDADGSSGGRDETKTEEKATDEDMIDEDEDPEEIIEEEEEEEADDDFRPDEVQKDDKADVKVEAESEVDVKMDVESVVTNESNTDKIGNDKAANANEAADKTTKPANANEAVAEDNKQNADQTDTVKDKDSVKTVKEASTGDVVVDKELLEAFRYFDKNRTGYIKVQDLRCILHNLGKFMSNKHVKELAQSALLESNSARDDRVFYKKLVKMAIGDI